MKIERMIKDDGRGYLYFIWAGGAIGTWLDDQKSIGIRLKMLGVTQAELYSTYDSIDRDVKVRKCG